MSILNVHDRFATESQCIAYLEKARWNGQPICPYCISRRITPFSKEGRYHCNNCNTKFSVTVGTVFHHTHLPLQKWFLAITLILNTKENIPAQRLAESLGVNKNTACFIIARIDRALLNTEQRQIMLGVAA